MTNAITLEGQVRGVVDLVGGYHALESKEPVVGVLEVGWDVVAYVYQRFELRLVYLGT